MRPASPTSETVESSTFRACPSPESFSTLSNPTDSTQLLGFRPLNASSTSPFTLASVNPPAWAPSLSTTSAQSDASFELAKRMPVKPVASTGTSEAEAFARESVLIGAFGKALERCVIRHSTEVLETVLGANHEHLGDVIHALSSARRDYAEALENAIQRLAAELSPDCIMNVGETFRLSAGEITGALRRGEHLNAKILETLKGLGERLNSLEATVAAAAASVVPVPKPIEQKVETPRLKVVASTGSGENSRTSSPIERLDDHDDDHDEVN